MRLFDTIFGPRRPAPVTVVRRLGSLTEDWETLQGDGQRLGFAPTDLAKGDDLESTEDDDDS